MHAYSWARGIPMLFQCDPSGQDVLFIPNCLWIEIVE